MTVHRKRSKPPIVEGLITTREGQQLRFEVDAATGAWIARCPNCEAICRNAIEAMAHECEPSNK